MKERERNEDQIVEAKERPSQLVGDSAVIRRSDMAVFLINICKFNGCGITFPSLGDLIQHIEDTHIDYDPKVVEQKEQAQPACLPLSYVLRFISDAARKENPFLGATAAGVELKRKLAIKHHSYSLSSSNRSNTPTGSEMDEDEMVVSESEDSNDSWTTEEFSSEFIMRYGSRHSGSGSNGTPGNEKPFACPVPGCKKRYKNVNGIKYHSKNGHKKDGKVRKGYKCHCGKSYKTAQGLKSHALVTHNASPDSVMTTHHVAGATNSTNGNISMQRCSSPSQSLGSMSPSSISNMSSSNGSCHGASNGNVNNNNCGSNTLQHLTNVVGSAGCLNAVANGNHTNHHHQQQQQQVPTQHQQHQQQHLIPSPNSNSTNPHPHQQQQLIAATEASFLPPYTGNNLFDSSLTSTTMTITTPIPTPTPPPLPPPLITVTNFSNNQSSLQLHLPNNSTNNNSNINNNNNNANSNNNINNCNFQYQSSPISPTFIEHKYSANIFKEKFLANLRNNTAANTNHNKINDNNNNIHNNNIITHSNVQNGVADNSNGGVIRSGIGAGGLSGGGGSVGGGGVSVGGLCSIQQQFSENFRDNIFKKTIN